MSDEKRSKLVTVLNFLFLGMIFSLGFMRPNLRIMGLAVQATDALFPAAALLLAIAFLTRRISLRYDSQMLIMGIYFTALAASAIFSSNQQFSLFKLAGEAYLIGLAVMTGVLIRSQAMAKRLVLAWIAAASFVGFIGVVGVILFYADRNNPILPFILHHYGSLPPGNYPRIQSTFIYPSMLCNYLTVGVMFLFAANRLGWIRPLIFRVLLVIQIVAVFFTLTPGIAGFLIAILLWWGFSIEAEQKQFYRRVSFSMAGILAVLSVVVSAFTLRHIPTSPYSFDLFGTRIDPTQRLLAWQGALETFFQYPLFGRGLGLGVANVHFLAPSGQNQLLTDAHNIWLSIAGQAGIFGLASILILSISVTRRFMPVKIGEDSKSVLTLACGISFISIFFVQGLVGSFEDARHLWILIGMIGAISSLTPKREK